MKAEFKSCPECGSDNVDLHNDGHYYSGRCLKCGLETGKSYHKTFAIKIWNACRSEQDGGNNE